MTAHEIKIKSEQANEKARIPILEMNTIAKTYRALEEDEEGSE